MTFNSLQYALLLPVVVVVYWRFGRRGQNALLLAASYLFYGAFDWRFLGLLWISTATDFAVGRALAVAEREERRRAIFACSLVVNLGILGFFKYYDFFSAQGAGLAGRLGLHLTPPMLRVLLPVGISFYTFHGMSYTFDVYRRHIEPTRSLLSFAVFVAFFPQLVAGPIGRAHLQLPQFERGRTAPDADGWASALWLILQGLFKKIAIADALAPYVTAAFKAPAIAGWRALLVGALGFALQIYGDFSGYSDIARGSARLLGIELPLNFRQPYLSRSITEFWRRWHISLSTWLRDYLYVPLGGNRSSARRTYRNLMITMLIGGLWHGAAWTFVVWGGIHGLLLAGERRFTPRHADSPDRPFAPTDVGRAAATFAVVCLAWVFFRAASLREAAHYLVGIATLRPGPVDVDAVLTLGFAVVSVALLDSVGRRHGDDAAPRLMNPAVAGVAAGLFVVGVVLFSGGTPVSFIYFRF